MKKIEKKLSISDDDKFTMNKLCDYVLKNIDSFMADMEYKIEHNQPLSLLEQQLINEYTLTFLQVKAIKKSL